jgi:hypothetical protein
MKPAMGIIVTAETAISSAKRTKPITLSFVLFKEQLVKLRSAPKCGAISKL